MIQRTIRTEFAPPCLDFCVLYPGIGLVCLLTVSQNTYDNVQNYIELTRHSIIIIVDTLENLSIFQTPSFAQPKKGKTKEDTFGLKLISSLINYFYIQIRIYMALFRIQSKLSKNIYMYVYIIRCSGIVNTYWNILI